MDGARIFLKGPTQTQLIPMVETAYAAEYLLQEALASYPELLPGDQINPEEPRRWLLEFLNDKLMDVEVLAVEIKQYQGLDHTALVPRVVGLTEAARSRKTAPSAKTGSMTEAKFMDACKPAAAAFYEHVLALAKQRGFVIDWTTNGFAVRVALPPLGHLAGFLYGAPTGHVEFTFGYLSQDAEAALALRKQLLSFGVFREAGQKTLRAIVDPETIPKLEAAYDLILNEVGRMRQGGV